MPKLYNRLIEHFKNGNKEEYISEITNFLKIGDDKKRKAIAKAIFTLHSKIVERYGEYIEDIYGDKYAPQIHDAIKPIIEAIEILNEDKGKREVLTSDVLHEPIWGKESSEKSLLDLLSTKLSSSPQSQLLRLIHISGALIHHYNELKQSKNLLRAYAAALVKGDDKVLRNLNSALAIIKAERPKEVKKYIHAFDEILSNEGISINKRNVGEVSKILLLLAAHADAEIKRIPRKKEKLLISLSKKLISGEDIPKEERKDAVEETKERLTSWIEPFISFVLMNKSLHNKNLLIPYVHEMPRMPHNEKEEILDKFASILTNHRKGTLSKWIEREIENKGKERLGKFWDNVKSHVTNVRVEDKEYKIVFDKTDIENQIKSLEKLQSCFTPPNEAAFYGMKYILHPYLEGKRGLLVPGFARILNKRGKVIGRFTVMVRKTPSGMVQIMITSLPHGPVPKEVVERFAKDFNQKLKNSGYSTLSPIVASKKIEKEEIKTYVLPVHPLYDDGIITKGNKSYVVGKPLLENEDKNRGT